MNIIGRVDILHSMCGGEIPKTTSGGSCLVSPNSTGLQPPAVLYTRYMEIYLEVLVIKLDCHRVESLQIYLILIVRDLVYP